MASDKPGPVAEIRIGRIKAVIWANEGDGVTWHTVQVSRLYRDGETWKTSYSFGRDDLLTAAKVLDQAHTRIVQLQGAGASPEEPAAEAEE